MKSPAPVRTFKTAEVDHHYQNWFLDGQEFAAALRRVASEEHFPWLVIHADNLEDPKHTGGNIYEGVRLNARVIDFSEPKPLLRVSLDSPCHILLPHDRIRWFSIRSVKFWNTDHTPWKYPTAQDPSTWLTEAVNSWNAAIRQ